MRRRAKAAMVTARRRSESRRPRACATRVPPAGRSCYTGPPVAAGTGGRRGCRHLRRTCPAAPCMAGFTRNMAEPLQKIIANRYGGRNLPVTLVLPDGGRVRSVVERRDRDPRAHLARPEGARGAGDGGARPRLRAQRHRLHRQRAPGDRRSSTPWSARSRTAATRWRRAGGSCSTSGAATARTSATTTTSRTRSIGSGSIRRSSTRAPISDGETTRSTPRRPRSSTTSAASCGLPRASASSTSAAAGARSSSARRERYGVEATGITLSQNQFDYVSRGDRRARARRPGERRAARLPRPARGRRCTTRSRAWACSSTSASRASRSISARSSGC